MLLEGWGRYPQLNSEVLTPATPDQLNELVRGRAGLIARGNGRAYGDAAIGARSSLSAVKLDRMRGFDPQTHVLTAEAGVLLSDILDTFVPRGFFVPVVPGTKYVTLGGMIASDVHGKNHHRDGGFGAFLQSLKLVLPNGEVWNCSPHENPDVFYATIGGMGLTGVIAEASIKLKPIETAYIRQATTVAPDLASALKALDDADEATYSVAWIDCLAGGALLGRSLIYAGEHASRAEVEEARVNGELLAKAKASRLSVPLDLPSWTLNKASVKAFNEVYFRKGSRKGDAPAVVHYNPYFFPLDGVSQWNRIYGVRGFLQHQCVVPPNNAHAVLSEILERFARSGRASFLAVLKKLGKANGLMSFPMPGYTLALDVQVRDDIFALLDEIDELVTRAGGRLYLAKDARQSPATFQAGYPGLAEFQEIRRRLGVEGKIASKLSERLGI
ncbi:FAD-binding protein [Devosia submarina]|uniref:FAD-binding protein n=1 Tax=Devosia submarina TaxID=1173082 RepID=UPI000D3A6781|nr:FAD-binding oxidoreductase [Devosia submarina]